MAKGTKVGLTLVPNMWVKLAIADKENATHGDLTRICRGIQSAGYQVKIIPNERQPQAILVER